MDKVIHFPDFERDLISHACYPQGRYLFNQHYQADVNEFPNGVWVVLFPYAPPPMHKFKICIQINRHKVTALSCTCHKNQNCEHTICALFYIREKFVDSDAESIEDSVDDENDYEEQCARYSGTNSFIDDREESDITVVEEEEENNENEVIPNLEEAVDEQERTLHKEFQCQICLEDMEIPVLFPCFSHSVCYVCAVQLFEKAHGSSDGTKKLKCPMCGDKYFFKIKEADELKSRINKGLKRMISSYKQEKIFFEKLEKALIAKVNEYEERLGIKQEVKEEEEKPRSQKSQKSEGAVSVRKPRMEDSMEEEENMYQPRKKDNSNKEIEELSRSQRQEGVVSARKLRIDDSMEEEKLYEPEIKNEDNGCAVKDEFAFSDLEENESDNKAANSARKQDLTEEESESLVSKRKKLNPLML